MRPIITYGAADIQSLRKNDERKLSVLERKILWKIYEHVKDAEDTLSDE